jgi:hypothetical protein
MLLFIVLSCCHPLLVQKPYEVEWDIKSSHTLFNHKFQRAFNEYKHMVTADKPTKITLIIKKPANLPLVYLPSRDRQNKNHVNVDRWHMKYIIEYTIESAGSPLKRGTLKTQCSYQDQDNYGNIFIAERGYEKITSQMVQEIIIILNT